MTGDGLPERLLRGDVVGGAEHAPVHRQPFLCQRARDAEVGDLRAALSAEQHVLRLDVAVDDLLHVCGAERAGYLDPVGERRGHVQRRVAADQILERLAGDVLEHDVRSPARLALRGT